MQKSNTYINVKIAIPKIKLAKTGLLSNMERLTRNGKPLENVVISGVSGRFPNSRNLEQFSHNLYNKVSH